MSNEENSEQLKKAERTEEVQEIIERMPTKFGLRITIFVLIIFIVFLSFGWIIKYPDIVTGSITINASSSPIKLVASTSGKLHLNGFKNFDQVREGDYVGILHNSANFQDIREVSKRIQGFDISNIQSSTELKKFPKDVSLGELNLNYFTFLNALTKMSQYHEANLFEKQSEILKSLIEEYKEILDITAQRLKMSQENIDLINKFSVRDSILLSKKVQSEAESDRSQINLISAQDAHQSMLKEYSLTSSQLQQTENQLQQNELQRIEKENQLEIEVISAFTDLQDNLKAWENKYVLKAPLDGKVQYLKFWVDNQFVQSGEAIFTIVPAENKVLGQMILPAQGAGKVKQGQEVIIKLTDYPYMEFGSVKGIVSTISLTTNIQMTEAGAVENYLVNVELPDKLKTNYGSELDFKFETKGVGDIIVHERRLIERLFDNLKYKFNQ